MDLLEKLLENAKEYSEKKHGLDSRQQIKGYWRASTMGLCGRQQAYNFLGYKQDFDPPNDKRVFLEDGHVHEEDLIKRILNLPQVELVSDNKNIRRTFKSKSGRVVKIAGTPDLEILYANVPVVIEIKAVGDAAFQEMRRVDAGPSKYVHQLKTYMLLLGRKRGILYVKNRNNSNYLNWSYVLDKKDKGTLLKRQLFLQQHIDRKKAPPKEYALGSQECFYCPHTRRCWGSQKFKGFIHKKEGQKDIQIDLDDEPKIKNRFMVAAKTFEKADRRIKKLEVIKDDAKNHIDKILKKFKADGASAGGYTAKLIFVNRTTPDKTVINRLIEKGTIPVNTYPSSHLRVFLPKGKPKKKQ